MTEPTVTGRLVAGRYRLRTALGHGGMGTVWRAHDEMLDREVAVKEVRIPAELGEAEADAVCVRTMREARTAARLVHPNVVTVFDVVADGGRPWIVMELVASRSLADVVAEQGPLPPHQVATIGLQVLAALRAAHAAGVLHRDVKPGNVLLADDGRVVLTDFGIATLAGDPSLTMAGTLLGSPSYIAPERARGEAGGPESDLWSLGATLYTAVEGRPPYERSGPVPTLAAVVTEEPDPATRAGQLGPVLAGLLRKDPTVRMGVVELSALLRRIAAGQATTTAPTTAGGAVAAVPVGPAAPGLVDAAAPVAEPRPAGPGGTRVLPVPAPVPGPVTHAPPGRVPARVARPARGWVVAAAGVVALVLGAGVLLGWTAMTADDPPRPGTTSRPVSGTPTPGPGQPAATVSLPPPAVDPGNTDREEPGKGNDGKDKDDKDKDGKGRDGERGGKGRDGDGEDGDDD